MTAVNISIQWKTEIYAKIFAISRLTVKTIPGFPCYKTHSEKENYLTCSIIGAILNTEPAPVV